MFMNKLLYLFVFLSLFSFSQTEKKGNVFSNTGDAAKMFLAKQKVLAGQYSEALNSFREIEKNNPKDAAVLYYVGYCYFTLKQIDKAKESLLKAEAVNVDVMPETYLILGKIYQIEENFDKSIEKFTIIEKADIEVANEANVLLSQCQNAKTMIAKPLNVVITNLGSGINSKYDDKNPCITADAKKLVFTTRRPEGTDALTDVEGDGKYFENIYISNYDSSANSFTKANGVSGSINTKAHDACTSISPDGKQIFIYKNDLNDRNSRGGDVFVSKINNDKWRTPSPIGKPIASSYWEGGACVSPDGKTYFFSSERTGGYGGSDIWMVEKINKKEWGKPVNLGPNVNSPNDEAGMFLAPDGKTLFFCSNGPKSMGSYDVFKSVLENGKWTESENLGYPINSAAKEGQLTVSADAKFAYVSSERKGGLGENDIYKIDLKDYAILEKDGKQKTVNKLSILKGVIRDGNENYGLVDAIISIKDDKDEPLATTNTNENGEYFLTLRGGKYTITVQKKGFTDMVEKIELPQSSEETVILDKSYLLKK
jgi:tetratricopeptide (TPR) repeat protein